MSLFKKDYLVYCLLVLIVVSIFTCIFTYSSGMGGYDLKDYFEGVFWAKASLEARNIYNPDYTYYYLVPFASNIIMAPLVSIFGVRHISNQLGMLIFAFIYFFSLYKLAKNLFKNRNEIILFCVITSLVIYTYVGDNIFHHILGYGIGFVCLLGQLACLIEIQNNNKVKLNRLLLILYCLWPSLNGIFSIALSTIPLLSALFVYDLFIKDNKLNSQNIKKYLLIIIPTIIGFIVYKYFDIKAVSLHKYDQRFMFGSIDEIVYNITNKFLVDYFKSFYVNPTNIPFFSFQGILTIIKFVFSLIVLLTPILFIIKEYKSIKEEKIIIFLISNMIAILVSLMQYWFSAESVFRYLFNAILSLFLIFAYAMIHYLKIDKRNVVFSCLVIFVLLFTVKDTLINFPQSIRQMNNFNEVAKDMLDENMNYGYTYSMYNKQLNLFTNNEVFTSALCYDDKLDKFYVEEEFTYSFEHEKPKNIDKFFILVDEGKERSLEDYCINKKYYDSLSFTVFTYDINDWDKVLYIR